MLKARETVASYVEKHYPNKAVVLSTTNKLNDNTFTMPGF